jgi:hypothetical protein
MHLYDAGVPLPYIRDILGHGALSTTDIYARASTEAKRKALEAFYDRRSCRLDETAPEVSQGQVMPGQSLREGLEQ